MKYCLNSIKWNGSNDDSIKFNTKKTTSNYLHLHNLNFGQIFEFTVYSFFLVFNNDFKLHKETNIVMYWNDQLIYFRCLIGLAQIVFARVEKVSVLMRITVNYTI